MKQDVLDLFRPHLEPMPFDGKTYQPETDEHRLTGQLQAVKDLMQDGCWRSLGELRAAIGGSEAGVSARLRDLRKAKFGAWTVERQHRGEPSTGLYEYRVSR
jgi:hypothetical protein